MGNLNIEKVNALYGEICRELDSCEEPSLCMDIVKKEFYSFSEIIRTFFVGKESEIKYIYNSIREHKFPYNRISCIDVSVAKHMYSDYIVGMIEFINKLANLKDGDNISIDAVGKTIEKVIEKDEDFISSIFGGEKNKTQSMDIDSAMKNIEELIDVEGQLSEFEGYARSLSNLTFSNTYKPVAIKGFKIYFKSVLNYNSKCIEEILSCYDKIHKSIQNRTPAKGVIEKPEYQLF